MPLDPRRVKALFQAALDLPDPAGLPAWLDLQCGDDPELRRRLDALLAAHEAPASALEQPLAGGDPGAATLGTSDPDPDPDPAETTANQPMGQPTGPSLGTLIAGRYKLRQEIGVGGMGCVYLADQTQPVRRRVALKLIKAGMDSRTVLARFESERLALALMDHPNIAKVLDAGTTEGGRPFFVMELVKGLPLNEYCDQNRLGLMERLTLFRQVCSAVQHAHQKGIIHRDLKPSNILVESHDGHPVPKVIDFGLAKATSGQALGEQSLFTAFGTVAGTPLYMAPEQAAFNALDVDTRADIYALGVILYELLTGSTPIQRETLRRAGLEEMLRVIREDEPPTPSSRLSTSEALPSLAAARHIEPSRLSRFVRGELDWIVMKALAKERHRRYESAIAFAQDVERFTHHEPVSAGPPTAAYWFRKFLRRHRPQAIAASLVLLALVGGVVGTSFGLIEARRQEVEAQRQKQVALAETQEKEKARNAEALQRHQAEKRLAQVEKANSLLGSIFKDLDPTLAAKGDKPLAALLGERLDQATTQIEGEAIGDPLAVARIQETLGLSQLGLGYAEKAVGLFTKAHATFNAQLGSDHPETLDALNNLARGLTEASQFERALPLLHETLALKKAKLGSDHPDTLVAMNNLAVTYRAAGQLDRTIPLYEEAFALQKAKLGPDDPGTLTTLNNLASNYLDVGKVDRAIPLLEEALARHKARFGPDHPYTLDAQNNLALGYLTAGQAARALPLLEETLTLKRARLGADHPSTLHSLNSLANGYRAAGHLDRALPLFEEALERQKARLGAEHPDTLTTMASLANAYRDSGQVARALPLLEDATALLKTRLGLDHPDTLRSMNCLAVDYEEAGKLDRAVSLYEMVLTLQQAKLGPDHPDTLNTRANVANAYRAAGQIDRALPLLEEALARKKAKRGADHPDTLTSMNQLAVGYMAAGKFDRALPLYQETLALQKAKLGAEHPDTLATQNNLAVGYHTSGQVARALPLYEEVLAIRKVKLGRDHPDTLGTLNNLAMAYMASGRFEQGLPLLEETLALKTTKLGLDHPDTLLTLINLDDGYDAAGKFDRSLPLRREIAEIRKRQVGPDAPEYARALTALGWSLLRQKQWTEAEPILRQALKIAEVKEPDAWTTFHAKSMLGGALLAQKRYTEAEPLLRAGYEGLKPRADQIPQWHKLRGGEAVDRLIELAEATDKPDDGKLWRAERARWPGAPAPKPEAEKQ